MFLAYGVSFIGIAMRARRSVPGIAVVAAIGTAVLLASTAPVSSAASAAAVPVVYGVPYGHTGSNFVDGRVRPTGMLMWTGDGSAWFVIHSYSSWSGAAAFASATVHVRSCWGACDRYKTEHTELHFYRVGTHDGKR